MNHPLPSLRFFSTFREATIRFSSDGCTFFAQALAFNALFAVFPLVVLALAAFSYLTIFSPMPEHRLLTFFDTFAPALHDFVSTNLQSYMYGRGISGVVAIAFLAWSGKNLFTTITFALNRALGVPQGRPVVHDIAISLVMLPLMGMLLLIALLLPVLLAITLRVANIPDEHQLVHVGSYAISFALVFIVCMTLYSFLPNRRLAWHFGIPGAALVACIWPLLQFAFAQYTTHVDFTRVYGALSAPFVILLWFYFVAMLFLFGAEFSTSWASAYGPVLGPDVEGSGRKAG